MSDLENKVEVIEQGLATSVSNMNAGDAAVSDSVVMVDNKLTVVNSALGNEVIHRSEGDLLNQGQYTELRKAFLSITDGMSQRLTALTLKQNADMEEMVKNITFVDQTVYEQTEATRLLILEERAARKAQFDSMQEDINKYLQILSDVTLDSTQITLDNGELRWGAWTILSQAREWDLEIMRTLGKHKDDTDKDIKDLIDDLQNQLPDLGELINDALEQLSNSPIIKELDRLLSEQHQITLDQQLELAKQAEDRVRELSQATELWNVELTTKAEDLETKLLEEAYARIDSTAREALIRAEQIEQEATDRAAALEYEAQLRKEALDKEALDRTAEIESKLGMYDGQVSTRIDEILGNVDDIAADLIKETEDRIDAVALLDNGLTRENKDRRQGDAIVLEALSTYKTSNENALSSVREEIRTAVDKNSATASRVDALDVRLTTNETETSAAKSTAASALSKASSAVDGNSALSMRVDALSASITELGEGAETNVDVYAFNMLKAEVTSQGGGIGSLVTETSSIKSTLASIDSDLKGNVQAVSDMKIIQNKQGENVTQLISDTNLIKNELSTVKNGLSTKADATAFNELTSTVEDQGDLITSSTQRIDSLSNTLNTVKNDVATKASTTSVDAISSKVTQQGKDITAVSDRLSTLSTNVTKIEGNVATKLDATVINNYFTKAESTELAATTSSGQITQFAATLNSTGLNLFSNVTSRTEKIETGWLLASNLHTVAQGAGYVATENAFKFKINYNGVIPYVATPRTIVPFPDGSMFVGSVYIKSPIAKKVSIQIRFYYTKPDGVNTFRYGALVNVDIPPNEWVRIHASGKSEVGDISVDIRINTNLEATPIGDDNYVLVSRLMVERVYSLSAKPSPWVEGIGGLGTDAAANAKALTSTTAEVTRINGQVIAQAKDLLSLSADIANTNSTLKNSYSTKSELNTAISNQTTSFTASLNAVKDQVNTKADSSVLASTNAEVSRINGEVLSHADQLLSLRTSVGNTNADLANNYTTKASMNEAMAEQATTLTASIKNDLGINLWSAKQATVVHEQGASEVTVVDPDGISFKYVPKTFDWATSNSIYFHSLFKDVAAPITVGEEFQVTLEFKANRNLIVDILYTALANDPGPSYLRRIPVTTEWQTIVVPITAINEYKTDIQQIMGFRLLATDGWVADDFIEVRDLKAVRLKGDSQVLADLTEANADAIQSINTSVERIDGAINTQSTSITSLNSRVDNINGQLGTKADSTALANLASRVSVEEGKTVVQAEDLVSLRASYNTVTDRITIKDTRDTNQPPTWYWKNHPLRVVDEFKSASVLGLGGLITSTYLNLSTTVQWSDQSGGAIVQEANNPENPSEYAVRKSTSDTSWSEWISPIKAVKDTLAVKAEASALQVTNATVSRINDEVVAQAQSLLNLDSKVNDNYATLVNNYYTKSQADISTSGYISQFKAGINLGGKNLLNDYNMRGLTNAWRDNGGGLTVIDDLTYGKVTQTIVGSGIIHQAVPVESGMTYTYSMRIKSSLPFYNQELVPLHWWASKKDGQNDRDLFSEVVSVKPVSTKLLEANVWHTISVTLRFKNGCELFTPFLYQGMNGATVQVAYAQFEKGDFNTDWQQSDSDLNSKMETKASAVALDSTNAEVRRVNGETISNANRIGSLEANVKGQGDSLAKVTTLADATASKAEANAITSTNLQAALNVYKDSNDRAVASVRSTADATANLTSSHTTQLNTLKSSTDILGANLEDAEYLARMLAAASLLTIDPTFKDGFGSVGAYNNYFNGTVTVQRTARTLGNPVVSGFELLVTLGGGNTTPGLGGFLQNYYATANSVFIHKAIMKFPVGYTVHAAANDIGPGGSTRVYGNNKGTGRFETYYLVTRCGEPRDDTTVFSTFGFFWFDGPKGTDANPVKVNLAYLGLYDATSGATDSLLGNFIADASSQLSTLTNGVSSNAQEVTQLKAFQGRRRTYRVVSNSNGNVGNGYITSIDTNGRVVSGTRSYTLVVFDNKGDIRGSWNYDVYGNGAAGATPQQFNDAVASMAMGEYAVVFTSDEPKVNSELIKASLISLGASGATIDSFLHHYSYILIGRKGLGEGQGIELRSVGTTDPVEYILDMVNGTPIGLSGNVTMATAMRGLTSSLEKVDGKTIATAEDLLQLKSQVGNNEASLVSKYATKSELADSQSSSTVAYKAALGYRDLPTLWDITKPNHWYYRAMVPEGKGTAAGLPLGYESIMQCITTEEGILAEGDTMKSGAFNGRLVVFRAYIYSPSAVAANLGNFTGDDEHAIYINNVRVFYGAGYMTTPDVVVNIPAGVSYIDIMANDGTGSGGFSYVNKLSNYVTFYPVYSALEEKRGTAQAIQSVTSYAKEVNGRVESYASNTTTLISEVNDIKAHPGENFTTPIDLRNPKWGQDTYYPIGIVITPKKMVHLSVYANLDGGSKPNWSTHTAGFQMEVSWSTTGNGWGASPVQRIIHSASSSWVANGQPPFTAIDQIGTSSWETIWLRGGGLYTASIPKGYYIIMPNDAGVLSDGHGSFSSILYTPDSVPVPEYRKNESNKVSLVATNEVVKGVKAVSTISVDNNGFMSGYGLISELVNGVVTSAFGVNADYFYVGNGSNKKKPFMVLNSPQNINGTYYPAGVWMDTAVIANATIGAAHIGSLNADVINAGTISANRIAGGSISGDKISGYTITGYNISGNSITADKLSVNNLSAISANLGTIQVGSANIGQLAVDTLHIRGNAVTTMVAASSTNSLSISTYGGPVTVNIGFNFIHTWTGSSSKNFALPQVRVLRNGSEIFLVSLSVTSRLNPSSSVTSPAWIHYNPIRQIVDRPGAGYYTYEVQQRYLDTNGDLGPWQAAYAAISLFEAKK